MPLKNLINNQPKGIITVFLFDQISKKCTDNAGLFTDKNTD